MKTLKLIALAAFALLFSQCKTTVPTAPVTTGSPVVGALQTLDNVYSKFIELGKNNTNKTPGDVMNLTVVWLQTQPDVSSVTAIDSTDLIIELKSGLRTVFSIALVGPDSISRTRGGDHPSVAMRFGQSVQSANVISNKNILFYVPMTWPYGHEYCLYHQDEIDALVSRVQTAGSDFKATVSYGESLNDVNSFGNYGVVFIDTHGLPFGFYSGLEFSRPAEAFDSATQHYKIDYTDAELRTVMNGKIGPGAYDKLLSGSFYIARLAAFYTWDEFLAPRENSDNGRFYRIIIGSRYIDQLPAMPGTIIVGNFCYSGWQVNGLTDAFGRSSKIINDPIQPAFTGRQLISYYSYGYPNGNSGILGDDFGKQMEDSLIKHLLVADDSTGKAHRDPSGNTFIQPPPFGALRFNQFGHDDYSYSKCGEPLTDTRDGQVYKTVCIGPQVWMAQNLNYNASGSFSYNNDAANELKYGRLYDSASLFQGAAPSNSFPSHVQGVCPKGWHIPSDTEFSFMLATLGGAKAADQKLRLKGTVGFWTSGSNSSGFGALPGGLFGWFKGAPDFYQLNNWAVFQTSTVVQSGGASRLINYRLQDAVFGAIRYPESDGGSCRCVKD